MKLSTKTRCGTHALVDLAIHQKGTSPVRLKDIAERQEISLAYLEHIVAPLVSAGLVNSLRGAHGGITLAKNSRNITLKDIIEVLEGPNALVECVLDPQTCYRSGSCATKDVWENIKNAMDNILNSITLQDIAERQAMKQGSNMYFI